MEFTIYSVGDVQFLYQILNSVAMICGTGDFTKLVSVGFLMGILFIGFQTIYQGGQRINLPQALTCFIVYLCMFGPSCTVVIEDTFSAKTRVVDNVPLGVGASGMAISNIGFKLTQMFEQGFGDVERTTEHGFADNLRILNNLRDMSMSDALFSAIDSGLDRTNSAGGRTNSKEALKNYLSECTFVNVVQGVISVEDLSHAGWGNTFKSSSQAHGTFLPLPNVPNNGYVSCNDGWDYLNNALNTATNSANFRQAVNRELKILDSTGNGPDDVAPAADFDRLESALSSVGADLQDTQFMMKSLVLDSVYDEAAEKFYSSYQDRTSAAAIRQAIMQRNTQWASESVMFLNVARALMAFFEGFLYAITPLIAFLLGIGSFGLSLAGKYFLLIAWIQLWMPVMAITNLYVAIGARGDISSHLGNVVSIFSFSQVWADVASWIATGGMLCAATPMIALFLITGSHYAFTSLAGRLGGQDHFNEKTVTPDVAQNAPVIQNTAMASHSVGRGTVMTDASIPNINLGQALSNSMSERLANIDAIAHQAALTDMLGRTNTKNVGNTKQETVDNTNHQQAVITENRSATLSDTTQTTSQVTQGAARESALNSTVGANAGGNLGGNFQAGGAGNKNWKMAEGWNKDQNLRRGVPTPNQAAPSPAPAQGQAMSPIQATESYNQRLGGAHDLATGLYAGAGVNGGLSVGGNMSVAATEKAAATDTFNKTSVQGKNAADTDSVTSNYVNSKASDLKKMSSEELREAALKTDNKAYAEQLNLLASEMEAKEKLMSMQSSFGINQELNLAQATQGMSYAESDMLNKYIDTVGMSKWSMDSRDRALFDQIEQNAQKYARTFGGGAEGERRGRAAAQMAFLLQAGEASHMEYMQGVLGRNAHAVHTNPGMETPSEYQKRDFSDKWIEKSDAYQKEQANQEQKFDKADKKLKAQDYMPKEFKEHLDLSRQIAEGTAEDNRAAVENIQRQEALKNIQNPPKELLGQEWAADLDKGITASLAPGNVLNPSSSPEYKGSWNNLEENVPNRAQITGLTKTQAAFMGLAANRDTLTESARSLGASLFGMKTDNEQLMQYGLSKLREENSMLMYGKPVEKLNEQQLNEVNKTTKGLAYHLIGAAKAPNEGHTVAIQEFNMAFHAKRK